MENWRRHSLRLRGRNQGLRGRRRCFLGRLQL